MSQCSVAPDLRTAPLASSHPFESSSFALQQLHLPPQNTNLATRAAISNSQPHRSSHTQPRQGAMLGNAISPEEYPRAVSSNASLSSNSMELPASSLADQYSSTLSSVPVLSSGQSYESSQFYPSESLSNSSYSVPPQASTTPVPTMSHPTTGAGIQVRVVNSRTKPQCWDHGCNGREFSTFSNLLRHQREKAGLAAKSECPYCGTVFTRTTARNGHLAQGKCKVKRQMDEMEKKSGASS
ncbi:hypothetical protein PRK78_003474 [Emydomyces testavorans]|uniref:Uncharacterized protein n=1 Tax=Emydomyces testavorans TaxID=2070801 RepID=A0AAF0DG93_9EURO|nr:hypothetical protein PRK78_003474 [Emydomyces testavorans]